MCNALPSRGSPLAWKRRRMAFERFYGCSTDKGLFGHDDYRGTCRGFRTRASHGVPRRQKKKGAPYTLYLFCECIILRWWDLLGMPEGTAVSESRRYLSAFRRSFRSNDSHPDISLGRSAFFADCSSNLVSLRIAVWNDSGAKCWNSRSAYGDDITQEKVPRARLKKMCDGKRPGISRETHLDKSLW